MDKKEILKISAKSVAQIVNGLEVELTAPNGEVFIILSQENFFTNKETGDYELHRLKLLFDEHCSENREQMMNSIWKSCQQLGIADSIKGISCGARQEDRIRIGARIRQMREIKGLEARDLARLADIDAANLSRIENGKYSVGIDVLSRIVAALGKKIDFTNIE